MAEKVTNLNQIFGGLSHIEVRLWGNTGGVWSPPTMTDVDEIYTLDKCVQDTSEITTDDGDENTINAENKMVIWSQNAAGVKRFKTEVGDLQDNILTGLFGCTVKVVGNETLRLTPTSSWYVYATVRLVFPEKNKFMTAWKVKLNPKVDAASISSDIVRGTLQGIMEEHDFGDAETPDKRTLSFDTING